MSENIAPPASGGNPAGDAPLAQNEYVQQLFGILQDNGRDTSGLAALLGHVSEMESFVKRADDTISAMKSQLAEMKEVQGHPVKTALQGAIRTLEQRVAEVKERLAELKHNIVEGCKSAVQAFKEKGISALDKLASFFHIKGDLQDWRKNIDGIIKADDKAVAKIEAFAAEYHSAGRAVKNMARVLVGKEPLDAKREAGKLARALSAPYKAQKAAVTRLRKSLDKVISSLDRLENTAAVRREHRTAERKTSLLDRLEAAKDVADQFNRSAPERERVKAKGAEL